MTTPNMPFFHDEDDPPPPVGYSDLHWWYLNRWAERMMSVWRFLGFIR